LNQLEEYWSQQAFAADFAGRDIGAAGPIWDGHTRDPPDWA
jgi:hypothetical protein